MFKHMIPTFLALIALSSNPVYAQGEGRRAIKAKDLEKEQLSAALLEAAHQNRLEYIKEIEETLASEGLPDESKAGLLFRVAEQYFQEGKYYFFKEMEAYNKEYDECFNTKGCNVDKMKEDHTESRSWQKKAIDNYNKVLRDFPRYSRADEVLFYLGSALQEIKKPKKALKQFERLTKEYSRSQYLPQAYVNIGEYYFDNNSAMKALAAYKKASEFQTAKTYGYAMYKLAWCYYNVQRYEQAISIMKRVVTFSEQQNAAAGGGTKTLTLKEEALKDMVRFYADADDMDGAIAYFNQLGRPELILLMLKRLGATYIEQGKFEQAVAAYRLLISKEPMSQKAPDYQYKIVQAYEKMNQKTETLQEIQKLRSTYGKDSAWGRENAANTDDIKRANRHVEEALRTAATSYHKESRKLTDPNEAINVSKQAEQAYRLYIQDYPSETYSYDIRYNFGELLFDLGDYYKKNSSKDSGGTLQEKYYVDAFNQYSRVIEEQPKGKYAKNCANSNITLAYNMFEIEEKKGIIKKRKNAQDLEVIDLAPWEEKYLKAMENYAEVYPKSKETINYLYEAGNTLFDKNRLDEAAERFRKVIAIKPTSTQAGKAAKDIVNALAFRADAMFTTEKYAEALKNYVALRDASKDFYDQKGLGKGDKKLKTYLYQNFEKSSAKVIESTFKGSDQGEKAKFAAATSYRQYVDDFPKSKIATDVLNLSAIYFFQSKNVAKSMEARQKMVDSYPESHFYLEHMAKLGYNYETIANFGAAADWYERLFKEAPTKPIKLDDKTKQKKKQAEIDNFVKEGLYRAAYFRKKMGQWEQSIANKKQYIETYPEEALAVTLPLDIANVYYDNGKLAKAANAFEKYYQKPHDDATDENKFYARLKHAEILGKQRKTTAQKKFWKYAIEAFDKYKEKMEKEKKELSPVVRTYIAEIMYHMAEAERNKYLKMKIPGPKGYASPQYIQRVLNKQIKGKIEKLREVEATYVKIVLIQGGKWSLEALVEIGKAYDNYAETIVNSYVPEFLDEEIYKMKLEDQSFSFKQKGITFYDRAIELAFENSIYTKATEYAMKRLGEFDPERYSKREEDILSPIYLSQDQRTRTLITNTSTKK